MMLVLGLVKKLTLIPSLFFGANSQNTPPHLNVCFQSRVRTIVHTAQNFILFKLLSLDGNVH